jgi:hypothetical protein
MDESDTSRCPSPCPNAITLEISGNNLEYPEHENIQDMRVRIPGDLPGNATVYELKQLIGSQGGPPAEEMRLELHVLDSIVTPQPPGGSIFSINVVLKDHEVLKKNTFLGHFIRHENYDETTLYVKQFSNTNRISPRRLSEPMRLFRNEDMQYDFWENCAYRCLINRYHYENTP